MAPFAGSLLCFFNDTGIQELPVQGVVAYIMRGNSSVYISPSCWRMFPLPSHQHHHEYLQDALDLQLAPVRLGDARLLKLGCRPVGKAILTVIRIRGERPSVE